MWRLANYLFDNGFNIYQLTLAGHDRLNPAKNWPQIDLKPEYAEPLMQKVQQDAVLRAAIVQKGSKRWRGDRSAASLAPATVYDRS